MAHGRRLRRLDDRVLSGPSRAVAAVGRVLYPLSARQRVARAKETRWGWLIAPSYKLGRLDGGRRRRLPIVWLLSGVWGEREYNRGRTLTQEEERNR